MRLVFTVLTLASSAVMGAVGDAWLSRNALPVSSTLRSIDSTGSAFIAVGKDGTALRSSDGLVWTLASTGTQANLNGITWTGSAAIAVGDAGAILTSSDGSAWAAQRSTQDIAWRAVTWTGSVAVAVGDAGAICSTTNADGTGWKGAYATAMADLRAVAGGGGVIVAVGSGGFIGRSTDALTWTRPPSPTTQMLRGVAFNGSVWVVAGDNGTVITSTDGISWGSEAVISNVTLQSVRWDGAQFIITGGDGTIFTSATGSAWTTISTSVSDELLAQAFQGGVHVSVGERGVVVRSSDNGVTWSDALPAVRSDLRGGVRGSSMLVAAGADGAIITSPDGQAWSAATSGTTSTLNSTAANASAVIAVADGGSVLTSADGAAWSAASTPTTRHLRAAAAGASGFVAVGQSGIIVSSADGQAWTAQASGTSAHLRGLAWSGSLFVAVGENGVILTSPNGSSWTARSSGVTEHLFAVAWGGSGFVAAGRNGVVLTSSTGTSWTRRSLPVADATGTLLRDVQWTGAEFVAVGCHGRALDPTAWVLTSYDGISWSERRIEAAPALESVIVDGSDVFAIGANGAVFKNVPSPLPTVEFSLAGSSFAESSGDVVVTFSLDFASAAAVRVNFTTSGTATIGTSGDATIGASPVTIAPGQTTGTIHVSINNDVIDEDVIPETIVFTLQSAAGALLGAQRDHTLSIVDDDTAPSIVTMPASRVETVGSAVLLAPVYAGDPTLKYQWSRNNVNIAGAINATYLMPAITLAQAGTYRVKVTNLSGSILSPVPNEIAVVDATNKVQSVVFNKTAVFTVAAAGNGTFSYQWTKDGDPLADDTSPAKRIVGSKTKTLTVKALTTADSGVYRCTVTTPVGQKDGGTNTLTVVIPPVVHAPLFGGYMVSESVSVPVSADNNPTKWTIIGLPSGLTYNSSTGVVSGRPLLPTSTPLQIKITASNAAGTSPLVTVPLTVTGLDAGVAGSYAGTIDRESNLNSRLGGRVTMTIAKNGIVTGSFALGKSTIAWKRPLDTAVGSNPTLTASIKRTGKPDLQITNCQLDPLTGILTGTLQDTTGSTLFRAWRSLAAPFTSWAGAYTGAIKLGNSNDVGQEAIPQGHGYTLFTVASSGIGTGAVRLADGAAVTFSSALRNTQSLVIYGLAWSGTGSVLGELHLTAGDPVLLSSSDLTWFKDVQSIKARSYQSGFGPLTIDVTGARYTPPGAGAIVMGLGASADNVANVALHFAEGGAPDPANRLDIEFRLVAPNIRDPQTPAVNPGQVTIAVNHRNGFINGSFSLSDLDTTVIPNVMRTRTVPWVGLISRDAGGSLRGFGYFNLPKMPDNSLPPGTTLSNSPILSGKVEMVPVP